EQMKLAMELAEKAVRTNSNKTPAQVKQKIQDILLRKGYSYTVVTEILEQIKFERAEDEWENLMEDQGEKIWRKFSSKFIGYELHNKVKQALYQKGFPVEVINQFIEQKEQEQHE
ncbi:MAG: RecX family transcriptional regulator, partial [Solibacillus sp.]